jgi:hypothetical protein
MKRLYKLSKEDKRELFPLLMASEELEVEDVPVTVTDNDKVRICCKVKIDGKETMFTEKLYAWLVDKEAILRV